MTDTIQWLGQGGFLFKVNGNAICIDPYLTDSLHTLHGSYHRLLPPPVLPRELKADLIISTHDHIDHLDEETVAGVMAPDTVFAGPDSCIAHFKSLGVPEERLRPLNRGGELKTGNVAVHAVFAEHTADSIGVVFKTDAGTVYLVGDSEFSDALFSPVKPFSPDIVITCINGKLGNMNYKDAAVLVRELAPKAAVPCHYGLFAENTVEPSLFAKQLEDTSVQCRIPEYGMVVPLKELL